MLSPCLRAGLCTRVRTKTKAPFRLLKTNAFVIPFIFTEAYLKGWQSAHVHGRTADFVFRRFSAERCLRSAPNLTNQTVCTRRYGAVRSLVRWLFLHRRLRSRQRGSRSEERKRHHTR